MPSTGFGEAAAGAGDAAASGQPRAAARGGADAAGAAALLGLAAVAVQWLVRWARVGAQPPVPAAERACVHCLLPCSPACPARERIFLLALCACMPAVPLIFCLQGPRVQPRQLLPDNGCCGGGAGRGGGPVLPGRWACGFEVGMLIAALWACLFRLCSAAQLPQ